MKLFSVLFLTLFCNSFAVEYSSNQLKCLVCNVIIEKIQSERKSVGPNKKMQIGGYTIDKNGKLETKLIPMASSSLFIEELLNDVCEVMEEYVRAKDKVTGELVLLKLMTGEGLNPDISKVDIVQDSDLNKSLPYYCEEVLEELTADFLLEVLTNSLIKDPVAYLCKDSLRACRRWMDEL